MSTSTIDTINACAAAIIAPTHTDAERVTIRGLMAAIWIAIRGPASRSNENLAPPTWPPGTPVAASDLSAAAISAGATLTPPITFLEGTVTDWPHAGGQADVVLDAIAAQYGLSPPGGLAGFLTLAGPLPGAARPAPPTDLFDVAAMGSARAWALFERGLTDWIQIVAGSPIADAAATDAALAAATAYLGTI